MARMRPLCLVFSSIALIWILSIAYILSLTVPQPRIPGIIHEPPKKTITKHILQLHFANATTIRLQLLKESPAAITYMRQLISNNSDFSQCNIYRAEPVPSYWGSEDYPDRYFDGGRWGPPYALVQGQIKSSNLKIQAPAEIYRPVIQRGMVAWAGGTGGPHFFIALANHPEWGHGHSVWANVLPADMPLVDAIVQRPLKPIVRKRPPNLVYLQEKMDFSLSLSE